eukprot:jgi/Bigna1/138599/aug1.45_g13307
MSQVQNKIVPLNSLLGVSRHRHHEGGEEGENYAGSLMWNLQRFSRPSCLVRRFSVKTGLHRHGSAKSSRKKKLLVAVCFGAFGLFMRGKYSNQVLALDGNLPPQFRDSDYYTEPAPTPEELASISARLQSVRIGFLASNQKAKKVLGSIAHCANKYRVCIEHIPLAVDEKTHQDFSRNGSSKVNNKDSCRDRNLEDSSSFELPPQQQSHHHQQQQKFDIILHKIPNTGTSRISSQRMLNELQTANPNLLLIDPPSMAIRATDRALHAKLCIAHFNRNLPAKEGSSDKNSSSQHKFGFADSAVLLPSDRMEQVAQAREWVTRNKLTFPLLFKPLVSI